jgi:molybdopterin synthase sulfur carrier subunit
MTAVAEVHLPQTLLPLFAGITRCEEVPAATVGEAIDVLDGRYPGLRDRLCEPGPVLRRHIAVYVQGKRASLESLVADGSRVDVIAAITGG